MRVRATLAALAALCACAPVADDPALNPDPAPGPLSFAPTSDGTGDLSYTGFDGNGQVYGGQDVSTVNLATGAVTGGEFDGTLNSSRTSIALASGGTVTLTDPGATEYVRYFDRVAPGELPIDGVVGFLTPTGDMPTTGSSRYVGAGSIVATDSTAIYDLNGSAVVDVFFEERTVDIEIGSLTGTRTGISGGTPSVTSISDGGTVLVEGSQINGASFSGGLGFASGTPFDLSGSQNASATNGGFFGDDADEVAGRVVIDDPDADVQVLGRFAAD